MSLYPRMWRMAVAGVNMNNHRAGRTANAVWRQDQFTGQDRVQTRVQEYIARLPLATDLLVKACHYVQCTVPLGHDVAAVLIHHKKRQNCAVIACTYSLDA